MKKLTIGFSPCPNDTFIFDALVNKKMDTGDLEWEVYTEDVETLNEWAGEGKLDVTKLSFPAYFRNADKYQLLKSGAALAHRAGPLLISKEVILPDAPFIQQARIALPGKNTTANLLFTLAYPDAHNKKYTRFDRIEDAVLSGETDLGVIIHENRFTYQQRGLKKVLDLGDYWEEKTKQPIPLGGIAVKRDLDHHTASTVERMIRQSLEYAFARYPDLPVYVKEHAHEMNELVMRQHIQLYVNDFSLAMGTRGQEAVKTMYGLFQTLDQEIKPGYSSGEMFLL